jgi:hypothetical protein
LEKEDFETLADKGERLAHLVDYLWRAARAADRAPMPKDGAVFGAVDPDALASPVGRALHPDHSPHDRAGTTVVKAAGTQRGSVELTDVAHLPVRTFPTVRMRDTIHFFSQWRHSHRTPTGKPVSDRQCAFSSVHTVNIPTYGTSPIDPA